MTRKSGLPTDIPTGHERVGVFEDVDEAHEGGALETSHRTART